MNKLSKEEIKQRKEKLASEQFNICFLKGTEPPFSGSYNDEKRDGIYECVVCEIPLFSSSAKFDSGTGWPSFDAVMGSKNVKLEEDLSLGLRRVEVQCARCGAHLGHLFDDGPTKTGKRYCINSLALNFNPKK